MNKNSEILLKVRNVKKYFHTPGGIVKAIDDVSFDVKQGEIIGLIGESGSGKTTVGRCLIRLYDQYSGLVNLEGQAISGNKLSKNKKNFLNQNMQMIFQDPHASLNGQQNIYTILKEPLIVNKIMKQEYKDFFSDWDDVINNFRYEFQEELRLIELDTITYHATQAEKLLKEWVDVLRHIKFNYNDIENDFNQYFAFKLINQEREENVITKIFQNNSKILDLYFDRQKKFRNNEIIPIEQKLKQAKDNFKSVLAQSKITDFEAKKAKIIAKKKGQLKSLLKTKHEAIKNHSNIISSYINEFKNSYVSHLEQARAKNNFDDYNFDIKFYLLSKKIYDILKSQKAYLIFISGEETDHLINLLKKYRNEFNEKIEKEFKASALNKYHKELKEFIDNNFVFDLSKFTSKSIETANNLNTKIKTLRKEIKVLEWTFSKDKNLPKIKSKKEVEEKEKEYLKLKEDYQQEIFEYSISFNKRMDEYRSKMIYQHEKLNSIREELKKIEEEFNMKHQEFLKGLEEYLESKGKTKKQIKNQLSIYDNRVKSKNETLQAFNFEIENLKKDLDKLKKLLGIKKSYLAKKHIKKILMNEKIYRSLEDVGLLRQFAWRYPHEFSGGQRQRIVIARALISNPKIIIADEPIASLDVSIQAQVVNILKELCEKKNVSLIFIAHDLSMVEYIADKILIMHLGKIVEFGKTEEIYSNPLHPYTINLFKSMPKISNANDKFESSNFELDYLEEQHKKGAYVDFFEYNQNHVLYSTMDQFRKWTKQEPKLSNISKSTQRSL